MEATPTTETEATSDLRCNVTERDRELVALLAITRYLTTNQANALVRPGRDESVGRRRLYSLAGLAPRARPEHQPPAVFRPPLLRRLRHRKASGERVDMWALDRRGEALACEVLGREVRTEREDVTEPLREHWAATTDLLVGIAAPLLANGHRVQALPLRWESGHSNPLPWSEYDMEKGKSRARLIVPDATLVMPERKLRVFVECEMGTHSVVATSDEKAGATVRKMQRYEEFLGGYADPVGRRTHYAAAFPDGWRAEVLYLVRTTSRRNTVNAALKRWRAERSSTAAVARVLTLDEAIATYAAPTCEREVRNPRPAGKGTTQKPSIASEELALLRQFYQSALIQLGESGRAIPEEFRRTALRARSVLQRIGGALETGGHS